MSEALKPCPFCGRVPDKFWQTKFPATWYRVSCNCGAESANCENHEEAAKLWNRRAAPPLPALTPEEARPTLEEARRITADFLLHTLRAEVERVEGEMRRTSWNADPLILSEWKRIADALRRARLGTEGGR